MADKHPPRSAFARWRQRRRLSREGRQLIKETHRILRKQGFRLKPELVQEIRTAKNELQEAIDSRELPPLRQKLERLDHLVDKHLSFARKSAAREYSESIGIAVIVALLLRTFVIEAFKIPSGSMIPTLDVGDHIFVNKFIYGLRIPWTHIKFFEFRKPHRGEVIVFIYPGDESKDFIKRVIAVGGDTVAVKDNVVYVNGKPVPRKKLPGPCVYADSYEGSDSWEPRPCEAYEEELDGTTHDDLVFAVE